MGVCRDSRRGVVQHVQGRCQPGLAMVHLQAQRSNVTSLLHFAQVGAGQGPPLTSRRSRSIRRSKAARLRARRSTDTCPPLSGCE